jgi:O-Antigen ligase
MQDVFLALGLFLSTASQLRAAQSPVGPGEICLVIWIIMMLGQKVIWIDLPLSPAFSRILIFWSIFAVSESLGTLTGYVIGDRHDSSWFIHDIFAYVLVAIVSCLSVVEPRALLRLRRVVWLLILFGSISLAVQLSIALELLDVAGIKPWYWDRFRGWSANPNQLALFCAFLALLALYLIDVSTRVIERIIAFICLILAIWVGRLSKSDTFNLVLIGTSLTFVMLKFRIWLLAREWRLTLRTAFAWIFVLTLPAILASAAPLSYAIIGQTASLAKEMSKDSEGSEEETQLRFHLWNEALNRGLESGMLGLGPGPHLAIPSAVVASRMSETDSDLLRHPEANSFPNFEAHNTLLDLFTQGGLIAVLSVIWISFVALSRTFRAGLEALTTLIVGMAIFSISHLIIRQPLFWFVIALCLVTGSQSRCGPAQQSGRS